MLSYFYALSCVYINTFPAAYRNELKCAEPFNLYKIIFCQSFFNKIKEALVGKSAVTNEKYRAGLDKSSSSFSDKLNALAARYREVDDAYFDELENILIMSDVGVSMVMTIVDEIKKEITIGIINATNIL